MSEAQSLDVGQSLSLGNMCKYGTNINNVVVDTHIVVLRATWGCGLTCCSPRPHCAIKENDEGLFLFLATGDNGDDDDDDDYDYGTDAAITNNDEDRR